MEKKQQRKVEPVSKRALKEAKRCTESECLEKNHVGGLCKRHYDRKYQNQWNKKRKGAWWKNTTISQGEKNLLRLVLLRFKWGYETEIDHFLLCDFYLRLKGEFMATYEQYGDEKYALQLRKALSNIFK